MIESLVFIAGAVVLVFIAGFVLRLAGNILSVVSKLLLVFLIILAILTLGFGLTNLPDQVVGYVVGFIGL